MIETRPALNHREAVKRYYRRRIAEGKCTQCGDPCDRSPRSRCSECLRVEKLKRESEPLPWCRCRRRRVYRATCSVWCFQCRRERRRESHTT